MEPPLTYACDHCRLYALPPGRILHVAECECGTRWVYCSSCGGNRQVVDGLLEAHAEVCRLAPHRRPPSAA